MLDGMLVEFGPATQVLERPRQDYARALIAANSARWPAPVMSPAGELVVTASGLSKRYGEKALFKGLDVSVTRGAIVGPSGCGKTSSRAEGD